MIKNYLKTAIRNIFRNKAFSFTNILGLSVGMAVCMLIITLTKDLKSYDRFHEKKDHIYRVVSDRTSRNSSSFATVPFPVFEELIGKSPAIEKGLRIKARFQGDARYEEQTLPLRGIYAEPAFFELFDFEFLYGDSKRALVEPYSIVLTEEMAKRFGFEGRNPVGEVLAFNDLGNFRITGVLKEIENKTHLQFETLVSFASIRPLEQEERINSFLDDWSSTNDGFIYLLLNDKASPDALDPIFQNISDQRYADVDNFRLDFRLQKLTAITPAEMLENDLHGTLPKTVLSLLTILAAVVLLTACFNYTNLSVARALTRAKEVGLRKIVGARRGHVFFQFICEAVLIALFALVVAWVMLEAVIAPQFEKMSFNQFLDLDLSGETALYGIFLVFSLVVGILSGLLPAVYLSRFQPAKVLKSLSNVKVFAGLGWRKVLLVLQFVISLILIITVTVLFQQTEHMLHADYGFDQENIINLRLQGQDFETFKAELSKRDDIIDISACSIIPGTGSNQATSIELPNDAESDLQTHQIFVDDRFVDNLDLTILAGKKLEAPQGQNLTSQVLINETGARRLGWQNPLEALGESIVLDGAFRDGDLVQITGIMKDFPYMGVIREPGSLVLRYGPDNLRYANLRIQSDNIQETLSFIEDKWAVLDPVHSVQYSFFDEQVGRSVSIYQDLLKMLGFLAFVAIVITCLGLLGMATYSVETRTKEIGIRKVLGASLDRIIWTLSKGLFYPLLAAIIVALPAAWYLNNLLLQDIAYRIGLTIANMGFGVLIILVLGSAILTSQALRIAKRNPVEALKYE